jgi:hypothetical protein
MIVDFSRDEFLDGSKIKKTSIIPPAPGIPVLWAAADALPSSPDGNYRAFLPTALSYGPHLPA